MIKSSPKRNMFRRGAIVMTAGSTKQAQRSEENKPINTIGIPPGIRCTHDWSASDLTCSNRRFSTAQTMQFTCSRNEKQHFPFKPEMSKGISRKEFGTHTWLSNIQLRERTRSATLGIFSKILREACNPASGLDLILGFATNIESVCPGLSQHLCPGCRWPCLLFVFENYTDPAKKSYLPLRNVPIFEGNFILSSSDVDKKAVQGKQQDRQMIRTISDSSFALR